MHGTVIGPSLAAMPLHLDEFSRFLRYHGFPVEAEVVLSAASRLRLVRQPDSLATWLKLVIGVSQANEAAFDQLYQRYLMRYPAQDPGPQEKTISTEWPDEDRRWWDLLSRRRFLLSLQLIMLLGLGYLGMRSADCYLQTRDPAQAYRCFIGSSHLERSRIHPGPPPADSLALLPPDTLEPGAAANLRLDPRREPLSLAQQVPLAPAGPLPSDISHLQKSWFDRYRLVFKWLAVVGIFSLLLFIHLHRRLRRQWYLKRDRARRPPLYLEASTPQPWCDFSQETGFRQVHQHLVQEPDAKPYLLLIEQNCPQDLLARYYDELGQQLAEQGGQLVRFFFEEDPRLCWQPQLYQERYLDDLLSQYPGHRLVIIAEARRLFDPQSGQPSGWVDVIPAEKPVAFVSPDLVPSDLDFLRDMAERFTFLTATPEGLSQLVIDRMSQPESWEPLLPPPISSDPQLLSHLQQYFRALALPDEADPEATAAGQWRWLCTCALASELSWDLTLALGQRLQAIYQQPVASPRRLLHLLRLPWFRRGHIPADLREQLRDALDREDETLARQVIVERLRQDKPPANSFARDDHQLRLAAQEMHLPQRWDQRLRIIGQVRAYTLHHDIDDELLRRELETMPEKQLSFSLPSGLRRALFTQGIPVLGLKPWVRSSLGLGLALAILTLFQAYPWAHWQRYDREWYYLADDTARMQFYHFVGVSELAAGRSLAARNNLQAAESIRQTLGLEAYVDPAYHLAYLDWQNSAGQATPAVQEAFEFVSNRAEQALADSSYAVETRRRLSDLRTRARYNQGMLLLQGYQPERALEAFREAAKQDSSDLMARTRYAEAIALVQNSLEAAEKEADQQLLLAAERLSELGQRSPDLLDSRLALAEVLDSMQTSPGSAPRQQRYAELAAVARGQRPDTLSTESIRNHPSSRPRDDLAAKVRMVTPFEAGIAVVTYRGRYGFLRQGEGVIGGQLPYLDARPFQEGLAAVQQDGRWGFVDEALRQVIDFRYHKALDFRDGWAAVRDDRGYWGIIDRQGQIQFGFRYEKPVEFELESSVPDGAEALAVVYVPRKPVGKYRYINKRGEVVFPDLLFQAAENFEGSLARVMRYDVYHYLDRQGQCVGAQQPGEACPEEIWGRELLRVLRNHRSGLTAATFGPGEDLLVTAGMDSVVRIWSQGGSDLLAELRQGEVVREVAVSAQRVATGNDAGQISLWRRDGTQLASTSIPRASIWSMAYRADGSELAAGTRDGEVFRLDGQTLRTRTRLRTRQGMTVLSLAYDPRGRYLAAGSQDGFLRLWSTERDALLWQAEVGTGVQAVAFHPDGEQIAAGNRQGRITFYDSRSGNRSGGFHPHRNWLSTLQYSPNGAYLLTASFDRQVKVFRLVDRREVLTLRLRTTVTAASFSPDGRRLVVATRGPSGDGLDQVLIFELDRY